MSGDMEHQEDECRMAGEHQGKQDDEVFCFSIEFCA